MRTSSKLDGPTSNLYNSIYLFGPFYIVVENMSVGQGEASLDVPNLRGVTPLGQLQTAGAAGAGAAWLGGRVTERVRERSLPRGPSHLLHRLSYDKV